MKGSIPTTLHVEWRIVAFLFAMLFHCSLYNKVILDMTKQEGAGLVAVLAGFRPRHMYDTFLYL